MTSKNILLHNSNNNWKYFQNQQILKSTFLELLKSTKLLHKVCVFEKNDQVFIKATRLYVIPHLPSSVVALKTNSLAATHATKISCLEAARRD